MSARVVIACVAGLFLILTSGAAAFDHSEKFDAKPTATQPISLNGTTFSVPGPNVGTMGVVGVVGLLSRSRRRRVTG